MIRNKKKADEIILLKKRLTELRGEYVVAKRLKPYNYMRSDYNAVVNELNQTKERLKELGVKL